MIDLNPNCSEWVTYLYIYYDNLTDKEKKELNEYLKIFNDVNTTNEYAVIREEDMTETIGDSIKNTPYADKLKEKSESEYV